ncbi:N-acetyltransferase [Noviherbaspirillum cavernae]|uniref:N-acetyltransferase n=1 Tax=Noviherbaspirillum cavernae TaxID=2320862 RepID=A0A418X653_9BURK|nr:GNAT family protein [Noviherbaspirillum cavernae]RJG07963.1 N-acetyltransferase [Noviherbaspirillum cavernae]
MSQPFPLLLTERLRLRQIVNSDVDELFRLNSDADWMRWSGNDPLTERSQVDHILEWYAALMTTGTGLRWGLERKHDGRLIGTCGFFAWNKFWQSCLTGYEIAQDCCAQGYMREALTAIFDYGFEDLQLHRVQAEPHPDNTASIGLATRLGFRFEGVHREQAFWSGRFHDLHCYSLLKQEWHAVRSNHVG